MTPLIYAVVTLVDTAPRMTATGWRQEHVLVGTRHFCLRSFPGSPWLAAGVVYEADLHGQPLDRPPFLKASSRKAAFTALVEWASR